MPHAMLLQPMLARFSRVGSMRDLLDVAVHEVVALHGADMGTAQMPAACGDLIMVAQANVPENCLAGFARVSPGSGTACSRAAARGRVVHVADVAEDVDCAPYLDFARSVPFTSVLSAPLVASDGGAFGVISVHSKQKFAPTALELAALGDFTKAVADRLAASGTRAELAQLAAGLADEIQPEGFRCPCAGQDAAGNGARCAPR